MVFRFFSTENFFVKKTAKKCKKPRFFANNRSYLKTVWVGTANFFLNNEEHLWNYTCANFKEKNRNCFWVIVNSCFYFLHFCKIFMNRICVKTYRCGVSNCSYWRGGKHGNVGFQILSGWKFFCFKNWKNWQKPLFFAKKIAYILKLLSEERLILLGNEDRVACDQCANFQKKISRCFKDIPDLLLYFLYLKFFLFLMKLNMCRNIAKWGIKLFVLKREKTWWRWFSDFPSEKKFFV